MVAPVEYEPCPLCPEPLAEHCSNCGECQCEGWCDDCDEYRCDPECNCDDGGAP